MITVVSGHRRSGTSAMMSALYAGLKEGQILYQPAQERLNKPEEGYVPNPGHLYEVGRAYYTSAKFLRMMPHDSLVKILWDGLANLPKGDYTVIFMERDENEINASVARSDAHLRSQGVRENPQTAFTFDVFRPYDQDNIDHVLGIMEMRKDVRLLRVGFKDVIDNPLREFERISKYVSIDPEKAASVINPKFYRFRKDSCKQDKPE